MSSDGTVKDSLSIEKFKNRADSIFGCLDSLEKKRCEKLEEQGHEKNSDEETESSSSKPTPSYRKYNKKRRLPRQVPDHVIHPKNWMKYSLQDDGSHTLSKGLSAEQMNKRIALEFMNDLKERKTIQTTSLEEDTESDDKITFNKPVKTQKIETEPKTTTLFSSSHASKAHVMETFEFGCKAVNRKEKNATKGDIKSFVVTADYESEEKDMQEDTQESEVAERETFVIRKKSRRIMLRKRNTSQDEED